ncbi:MAG: rRNA maturation RNase YbeY [Bacteroidota bacterium]|jgi:rRNA maturation RNase YbeY
MAIIYQCEDVKLPAIKRRVVSKWIKEVAASYGKEVNDISYIFCSDEKILEVNNQYLAHDYYTDIITFDYSEEDQISGDVFVSLDTVKSNSEQLGTDYTEELHRIMIHGVLHLCGIKDKLSEESAFMTQCENKALEYLKTIQL